MVNRVTIKGKPKEVVIDYAVTEEKLDDDTDFDLEKPTHTVKVGLKIPVMSSLSVIDSRKLAEQLLQACLK